MTVEKNAWSGVVGQDTAVTRLRQLALDPVHAYMFLGPSGCTKEVAARAFASVLIAGTDDITNNDVRLTLAGYHPDVIEVRREGASISKEQAEEVLRNASLSPMQSRCKVIILEEFHLARPDATVRLLKTIEEPSARTFFIILADQMDDALVTIASRCVRIDFRALNERELQVALEAEGIEPSVAISAASSAGGDLDRARLLATDPMLRERRDAFANVPHQLNGSGTVVVHLVAELTGMITEAAAPLEARQEKELLEFEKQQSEHGFRGGRKTLTDEHKRQLRRHRADELKAGLNTIAATYRDAITIAAHVPRANEYMNAIHEIHSTMRAIDLNANEALFLQALFLKLPSLP